MLCGSASKYKGIAAGILGILMFVIMLLSAHYIAAEADHECTGEDCPICACVQLCENTLHQLGDGIALMAAVVLPIVLLYICAFLYAPDHPQETPVSRKVRLNN